MLNLLKNLKNKKLLKKIVINLILIYCLSLALLYLFQRKLQYIPMGRVQNISEYKLENFEEKIFTTKDGVKILSWFRKSKKDEKIILYFHGNAGNIGDRSAKFDSFSKNNFGVLAATYRGYSGSQGKPSQDVIIEDAEMLFNFLLAEGYKENDIILFGESLGSGVASQLAARHQVFAVILESPFSSIVSVAQKRYWFAPVSLLLKDKFESDKVASKITSPVLIIHGTSDNVVPYNEGKKLFEKINSKKRFVTVENAGHLGFDYQFLIDQMKGFMKD